MESPLATYLTTEPRRQLIGLRTADGTGAALTVWCLLHLRQFRVPGQQANNQYRFNKNRGFPAEI